MTLRMLKSIHCGQIHVDDKVVVLTENFVKNHEKMSDPKLIQNHSRKLPRASGHQNTS